MDKIAHAACYQEKKNRGLWPKLAIRHGQVGRGIKRAILAVAHSLIIIGYHLQKSQHNYEELGGDYFDRIDSDGVNPYFIRRLEKLGHKVALVPIKAA